DPDNAGVGKRKQLLRPVFLPRRRSSMTEVLPIRRRGERTPTGDADPHWQFPNSRKVYVNGVGMREIALSPTRLPGGGLEENPPLRVYDTGGPYSDRSIELNVE